MIRTRIAQIAIVLWVALIVAVTIRVAVSKPTSQSVVPIYKAAGERWIEGYSLYAPAPPHDLFRYPPGFAALFAPLSMLPEIPAAIFWRLAGIALFLAGLWRFSAVVNRESFPLIAALSCPLMLGSFNNGQINVAIIGLALLGIADAAKGRNTAAAIWLALATGFKVYPLSAGLLMCLLVPRQLAWRYAIGLGVVFLFPFLLQEPGYVWRQHVELVEWMQKDNRLQTTALERVPRDWTVLTRTWLGWVPSATIVKSVSILAGLAFAGVVWFSHRRNGLERTIPIVVVLSGTWMTLFGPATESVTYCLLAPGAAWLVATSRGWQLGIATAGYLLHLSPVIRDIFPQSWRFSVLGPQAAGTLLLLAVTMWRVFARDNVDVNAREELKSESVPILPGILKSN